MEKKSDSFNDLSIQQAMKMASSDAGQQLYSLLQTTQGDQLQSAMDQAAAGDYSRVKETMKALLASEEAQALLRQLQENRNG